MKFSRKVTTDQSEAVIADRAAQYLRSIGFQQTQSTLPWVYRRSSVLAGIFAFSLKNMAAKITVQMCPGTGSTAEVELEMDINTFGQAFLNERDRRVWEMELGGLERAICTGDTAPPSTKEAEKQSATESVLASLALIACMIAGMVLGRAFTETRLFGIVGAVLGFAVGCGVVWAFSRLSNTSD